jgi:hypothetical protein
LAPYRQPRVACQRPLQLPLENLALQRPTPLLPPSLPVPVATAPAAEILTTTLPPPPTLPDTSAAPFDEMRPPGDLKRIAVGGVAGAGLGNDQDVPDSVITAHTNRLGVGGARRSQASEKGCGGYRAPEARGPQIGRKGGRSG